MPRGFHPCFAAIGPWQNGQFEVTFASDGWTYRYSQVPEEEWQALISAQSQGEAFNAGLRAAWQNYERIG